MRNRFPLNYGRQLAMVLAGWLASFVVSPAAAQGVPPRELPPFLRVAPIKIEPDLIAKLERYMPGDKLALRLFEDLEFTVDTRRVEHVAAGHGFNWYGTTGGRRVGDVVLSVANGVLDGSIFLDSDVYRIQRRPDGGYVAAQVNVQVFPSRHSRINDPNDDVRVRGRSDPPSLQAVREQPGRVLTEIVGKLTAGKARDRILTLIPDDGSQIDLMIAYTAATAAWLKDQGLDVTATLQNVVAKVNGIFLESGVSTRLHLVHTVAVDHTEISVDLEEDLDRLAGGQIGNLAALRDQHRADLVALFVHNLGKNYNCGRARSLIGIANPGDDKTPNDGRGVYDGKGFSVSQIFCAVNEYSFAHEVGHNLGAGHDNYTVEKQRNEDIANQVPVSLPIFDFARGFVLAPLKRRTVMAYDDFCDEILGQACPRIPRFSNPNLLYEGFILGIPPGSGFLDQADNVRTMNLTAWTVANFRNAKHVD